jgi:hypothetical protein
MLQVVTEILMHAGTNLRPSWDRRNANQTSIALRCEAKVLHCGGVFREGDEAQTALSVEEFHLSIVATWPSAGQDHRRWQQLFIRFRCVSMYPKVAEK